MAQIVPLPPRGPTPQIILRAAEVVFAANGFDGATTRAIADRAEVNAALIHYYFGSKEQLYETVYSSRSDEVNERRRQLLARIPPGGKADRLEAVLDALLRPAIELGRNAERGGQHYARLLSYVATGTDERSKRLAARQYDGIAREFIAALERSVEGLDRADAVWGYLQAISVTTSLMAQTGRARTLSNGLCKEDELEEIIARAVAFSAAGIRAMAALRGKVAKGA